MNKISVAIVGCGASGSDIALQLSKTNLFSNLLLLDINPKRTKKLSKKLRSINKKISISTFRIDATNSDSLSKLLLDVDIVINASSPLCNLPIMEACLESGTHYLDLASDPFRYSGIEKGTTIDEQLELNDRFIQENLIAITNTGFSPGLTDIICKHVVNDYSLDSLISVKIHFAEVINSKKLVLSWSPYILLLEVISPPTVFSNGSINEISSQESSRQINFPEPIGKINIRIFNGHPELRTIPDFLDVPVKYIEIGGGMRLNDMQLNDIIVESLCNQIKKSVIVTGDLLSELSKHFESPDEFSDNYRKGIITKEVFTSIIEIKGKKSDKVLEYRAVIQQDLDEIFENIFGSVATFMVSFVPAIIANEIKSGNINQTGVIAPAALDVASDILNKCKIQGLHIDESIKWIN
ncbi:MAG: hypothetical protein GF414_00840 [Candidatus Altiarchaeales archaeon]|nr:hypothetical protein [Candidatus Altiarchaeales archaeon]